MVSLEIIITVIISLSFLVFIHELGHFLAAKKVGVHVMEFSIGFPPKLFSKIVGKTEYMISLIPIGGYVRLKGQGIEDEDETDPENYASKSAPQRFLILVAGAAMNLLVTIIILPLIFFTGYEISAYNLLTPEVDSVIKESPAFVQGIQKDDIILSINDKQVANWKEVDRAVTNTSEEQISILVKRGNDTLRTEISLSEIEKSRGVGWLAKISPTIGHVYQDSPAYNAGLNTNDLITHIDSNEVSDWKDISPLVSQANGNLLQVRVLRDDKFIEFFVSPRWESSQQSWVLGIGPETVYVTENLKDSIVLGLKTTYFYFTGTFKFLSRLIAGKEKSDSVGGPVKIVQMMGEAAHLGFDKLLKLVAFISLQFAIFNLLPIPALDGGHIFFLLFESITGKTLSKNLRMSIQKVGFSLLLLLIMIVTAQDFGLFK